MTTIKQFVCLVLFAVFSQGTSINVTFFESSNSAGYFQQVTDVQPTCNNVPSGFGKAEGSIETDTCLIAFTEQDCHTFKGGSLKILPGSHNIGPTLTNNYVDISTAGGGPDALHINSFFPCNQAEGGPQLKIIMKSPSGYAQFQDVCGCRDLPKFLQDGSSIKTDNHGNSFMKYSEARCKGKGILVPAGRNLLTANLNGVIREGEGSVPIKSIGPAISSLYYLNNCIRLSATIYKFEFEDDTLQSPNLVSFENMIGVNTIVRNDASGKTMKEFSAQVEVTEGVDVDVGESFSKMRKVGVELNVEIKTQKGTPYLFGGTAKVGLKTAYEDKSTTTKTSTTKRSVQNKRTWQVKKQVDINPCTETRVNSRLEMVKDKLVKYKAYARVTGTNSQNGKLLTVNAIKKSLGADLEVLEELDEWTVAVVGNGEAKMNFGIETLTDVVSNRIEGCSS